MPVASLAAVARDLGPAPNPTPMRRSQFDEDEVTGKVPQVAESPRAQPAPQIVAVASVGAKSAPKVAAAAPVVARIATPEPVAVVAPAAAAVVAEGFAPVVEAPFVEAPVVEARVEAPAVIAHAAPAAEPEVFAPPPAQAHAIPEPTPLGPPFEAEVAHAEVARAKTPSPEPVAIVRAKEPEPKRVEVVAPTPIATDAQALAAEPVPPASRGRQFLVAALLILWILAVAAVVGLFFTGRLPMP